MQVTSCPLCWLVDIVITSREGGREGGGDVQQISTLLGGEVLPHNGTFQTFQSIAKVHPWQIWWCHRRVFQHMHDSKGPWDNRYTGPNFFISRNFEVWPRYGTRLWLPISLIRDPDTSTPLHNFVVSCRFLIVPLCSQLLNFGAIVIVLFVCPQLTAAGESRREVS